MAKLGHISQAIAYFEQSIQSAPPDQFYPYRGLTSVYYQLGDYEKALRVLERWLILHPNDRNVRPLYEEIKRSLASRNSRAPFGWLPREVPPP